MKYVKKYNQFLEDKVDESKLGRIAAGAAITVGALLGGSSCEVDDSPEPISSYKIYGIEEPVLINPNPYYYRRSMDTVDIVQNGKVNKNIVVCKSSKLDMEKGKEIDFTITRQLTPTEIFILKAGYVAIAEEEKNKNVNLKSDKQDTIHNLRQQNVGVVANPQEPYNVRDDNTVDNPWNLYIFKRGIEYLSNFGWSEDELFERIHAEIEKYKITYSDAGYGYASIWDNPDNTKLSGKERLENPDEYRK